QLWPDVLPAFLSRVKDEEREVRLPDGGHGLFIRHCHRLPRSARRGAERRLWTSPERLQMNLLNRLQRFGVEAPRVLAAGERTLAENHVSAFLLTRQPDAATPLGKWLMQRREGEDRAEVLHSAGILLARL